MFYLGVFTLQSFKKQQQIKMSSKNSFKKKNQAFNYRDASYWLMS